jgi:hypothetical protein
MIISAKTAAMILTALALLSTSCMMWSTKEVMTIADWPKENQKVLSVVKASGEYVRFSKSDPGLMHGNVVYGLAISAWPESVEVEGPFPSVKKRPDGRIYEVTDRNGRVHSVREVLKDEGNKLTVVTNFMAPVLVSVPMSEARLIQVKQTNVPLTLAAIAGGLAGAWLIWAAIAFASL